MDFLPVIRYHIILVAMTATAVFSFLMTKKIHWWAVVFCALDWFLINFLNRLTDVKEDELNGIAGVSLIKKNTKNFYRLFVLVLVSSLALSYFSDTSILPFRVLVLLIGFSYSVPMVFTGRRRRRRWQRLKELYFFKNFMSAVIFILTGFFYNISIAEGMYDIKYISFLAVFFLFFEISFEILYDLRDEVGDRAEGVPTYVVIHGAEIAIRIVSSLLVLSVLTLVTGFLFGILGVRELLFLLAPIVQWLFFNQKKDAWGSKECIWATHLATIQLLLFMVGNYLWLSFGLPENIFLYKL